MTIVISLAFFDLHISLPLQESHPTDWPITKALRTQISQGLLISGGGDTNQPVKNWPVKNWPLI